MGIGFCWYDQTHKQVYKKQIHSGYNQVGGSKSIAHQYRDYDS
jgi:hypothetical protein